MHTTVRFGVSLDHDLLEKFDALIERIGYDNRSKAVRDLIREKLVEEEWGAPDEEVFAAAFLVYDHHAMSVSSRLTNLQHEFTQNVISTVHVHIDEDNCLEIVVMKGTGKQVRLLGERMLGMRGVKYGKLNLGTSGRKIR